MKSGGYAECLAYTVLTTSHLYTTNGFVVRRAERTNKLTAKCGEGGHKFTKSGYRLWNNVGCSYNVSELVRKIVSELALVLF